jgi:arabinogalactan endo-1,4-beta-galactosidase
VNILRSSVDWTGLILVLVLVLPGFGSACGTRHEILGTIESPDAGAAAPLPPYIVGADISYVQQQEQSGVVFSDTDGTQKDIIQLLKEHGFNFIRLRTFVDPSASDGYATILGLSQPYCDLANTIVMGQRIKAAGLGFEVDFHYSDNWADPTQQVIPLAWQGDTQAEMVAALSNYTRDAIAQLTAGGARPDIVQIGNEITSGLLLTPGNVTGSTSNWENLAMFLNAGIAAVHSIDPSIKIMLHLDRCGDNTGSQSWIDAALANGVSFDILGQACYTDVEGPPSGWESNLNDLVIRYPNLEFMIVEYAENSTDLAGNVDIWRQANDIVFNLPGKKGLGTAVWEPTKWEETLFDAQGLSNAVDLPNPFTPSAPRIELFDQIATDYGLR